jgi:hypothetical protein
VSGLASCIIVSIWLLRHLLQHDLVYAIFSATGLCLGFPIHANLAAAVIQNLCCSSCIRSAQTAGVRAHICTNLADTQHTRCTS